MNRQWKGIGSYLVFFALICLVLMFFEGQLKESSTYTYQQFEHAMEEGEIVSATITPNQETPTGTVMYTLKDGTDRMTNILNTETTEEQLTEAGIPCDIAEVKGPGYSVFLRGYDHGKKCRRRKRKNAGFRKKPCADDIRR